MLWARLYLPPWAAVFTISESAVLATIALGAGTDTLATIADSAGVSTKTARRAIALGIKAGVLTRDDAGLRLLHGEVHRG
jgi:hypothetical protein